FQLLETKFHPWHRRLCNVSIPLNEATVEVDKTKERLEVLLAMWDRLIKNSMDFNGVHVNLALKNDKSQVFDFSHFKFTFSGLRYS
ncbi:hypothetical protein PAXRUDRAFT_137940, partial [Paxillus rubicundulus Ve08.2h10]